MKVTIIGGGVMGEVIARSLLERNILSKEELTIAEIVKERRELLAEKLGVKVKAEADCALEEADLVIFCVKPQNAAETLTVCKGKIEAEALVISIMAGISVKSIQEALGHSCVIRSMPNIPAQIGEGMTVWMAAEGIPDLKLLLAKVVFQTFGKEARVETDDMIDAATAVSGTGPAYIFYIAEKLIEASNALGFAPEESVRLVRQTFQGAMDMWDTTREPPEKLRKMVTSKKGTTEAAIKRFEELNTGAVFKEAVSAAYLRAKELGKEFNSN